MSVRYLENYTTKQSHSVDGVFIVDPLSNPVSRLIQRGLYWLLGKLGTELKFDHVEYAEFVSDRSPIDTVDVITTILNNFKDCWGYPPVALLCGRSAFEDLTHIDTKPGDRHYHTAAFFDVQIMMVPWLDGVIPIDGHTFLALKEVSTYDKAH